jgi:hypothetical protein
MSLYMPSQTLEMSSIKCMTRERGVPHYHNWKEIRDYEDNLMNGNMPKAVISPKAPIVH